jgi:hypothetical protein
MRNVISFDLVVGETAMYEDSPGIRIFIDGENFREMVKAYEEARGYEPAGSYAGLVPAAFWISPGVRPFIAPASNGAPGRRKGRRKPDPRQAVLGCGCGDMGCWPLLTLITVGHRKVTWSRFKQFFRPEWDYSDFGAFVFNRRDYEDAVAALRRRLEAEP